MSKYKIVFGKGARPDLDIEREVLKAYGCKNDYELILKSAFMDEKGFFEAAKDADAVCAFIPFGADVLDKLPKCQVVAVPALGTDYIFSEPATERGICMTNLPVSYCIEEVAAHTCALILNCSRRITMMDRGLKAGVRDWTERWAERGELHRLKGRTYGLASFGNIARRAAEMMKGFGLEIMAYDPFLPDSIFEKAGAKRADSLEELFASCDIISVHTPYMPQTYHMIGKKQFDAIQGKLILIVAGRGGVVDEDALKAAIQEGKISEAGLDVLEDETAFESVLFGVPEVIITPHTAYYSVESEQDIHKINLLDILDVLEEKKLPKNLVNRDVAGKARFQRA